MARSVLCALFTWLLTFSFASAALDDEAVLKKLNLEIAAAEDRGDRKWLEGIMATELAFRRASGAVVGREQFLKDVKPRTATKTRIDSVKLLGKDRAVVNCTVTVKIDGKDVDFHNLRVFVREGTEWKLLAWANERAARYQVPFYVTARRRLGTKSLFTSRRYVKRDLVPS